MLAREATKADIQAVYDRLREAILRRLLWHSPWQNRRRWQSQEEKI